MSNLLDRASVVLTPTAYNNGEALCIKPDDGSGDFQFSRNSAATRVNAQGLVENVQILSSNLVQNPSFSEEGVQEISNGSFSQEGVELVTNGSFDTDTNWVKGTGWSISDGKLNAISVNSTSATQSVSSFIGKSFKVVYTISNYSQGDVRIFLGGAQQTLDRSENGTFTEYITITSGNSTLYIQGVNNFTGSIDNFSVREVGQNWDLIGTATITESQANIVTASAVTGISQSNILTIGKSYKLSYNIVSNNNGGLKISGNEIPSVIGNNIYYFEASAVSLEILRNSGITDISITNISVKEVGQNWDLQTGWEIGDNIIYFNNPTGTELSQQLSTTTGKYKIKFDLDLTSGNCQTSFASPGTSTIESFTTSGTKEVIIETTSNYSKFRFVGLGGSDFSITNISVIEITTDTSLPRINYEGFSYQDALGSEEIVNGDFSNGSANWTLGTGWSIGNSVAIRNNVLTNTAISQSLNLISGKTYEFNFTVNSVTGTGSVYTPSTAETITTYTTTGNKKAYFTPSNTQLYILGWYGIGSAEIEITNISVKEYLGQEVVPDSGCGSWLWESQSTNLFNNSEDFSSGSWVKTDCSVVSNFGVSPSGQTNASKLTFTTTNDQARAQYNLGSLTTGNTYTQSYYIKSLGTDITLRIGTSASAAGEFVDIIATSEWQRFEFTGIASGTTEFPRVQNITGTLGTEILVWGAQLEQQSYATSYIPTSGSTVTRIKDLCTNGGSLASINSTSGTLYAEIATNWQDVSGVKGISLKADANNYIAIYFRNSNFLSARIVGGGNVTQLDTTYSINTFYKVAVSYTPTSAKLYVNGSLLDTDTINTLPTGLNNLSFNRGGVGTGTDFEGKTKCLAVWKEALTDEELTELTTI